MRKHFVDQNNSLKVGKCQFDRPSYSYCTRILPLPSYVPSQSNLSPCRWLLLSLESGGWRWTLTRTASVAAAVSAMMSIISRSPARGSSTTGEWVGGWGMHGSAGAA